ncbi:hypothetical protein K461DRAFT_277102 [Myriangium duriaei CBS 260.36]|uniref:Uncharacterized protein n=1 Tax=Myriangium duriaei CBS 260.36 TaxID=1168546 RepID=A0A9P4MGV0_9PEZI|nr:hypothetical protein K461DRAFT_277102 [Myriangium duriaei CBS 260.36]
MEYWKTNREDSPVFESMHSRLVVGPVASVVSRKETNDAADLSPAREFHANNTFPTVNISRETFSRSGACLDQVHQEKYHTKMLTSAATEKRVKDLDGPQTTMPRSATTFSTEHIAVGTRKHYRDARKVLREIWMPGDGDGQPKMGTARDQSTNSWRFFQSPIDDSLKKNLPPKYVMLDDKAAHEVFQSKFWPRRKRCKYWGLDFVAGSGTLFTGRPNRGRPAWISEDGNSKMPEDMAARKQLVHTVPASDPKKCIVQHLIGEPGGFTAYLFDEQQQEHLVAGKAGRIWPRVETIGYADDARRETPMISIDNQHELSQLTSSHDAAHIHRHDPLHGSELSKRATDGVQTGLQSTSFPRGRKRRKMRADLSLVKGGSYGDIIRGFERRREAIKGKDNRIAEIV